MGYGMSVICQNCGKEEIYMLGIGMFFSSLENALYMAAPRPKRKRIQEILSSCKLPISDYEYKLYTCPRCNTLYNRFYVNIYDNDISVYESKFKCGKCRKKLIEAKKGIHNYNCSFCGRNALKIKQELLWD